MQVASSQLHERLEETVDLEPLAGFGAVVCSRRRGVNGGHDAIVNLEQ
jgi:hypothetical protein